MIDKINNLVNKHRLQLQSGVLTEVDTIVNLIQIDKSYLGGHTYNLNRNYLTDFNYLKPRLIEMMDKVMKEDKRIKGIKDLMNQFSKQYRNFTI